MTGRDPPRGVSPLVVAAALALGAALLLPTLSSGDEPPSHDPAACPPTVAVAPR
jgi:hypothetical protein